MFNKVNIAVSRWAIALFIVCAIVPQVYTVHASPFNGARALDVINLRNFRRQDPGPQSAQDPSGIEPEDEDSAQILADGTDALRSGKRTISVFAHV